MSFIPVESFRGGRKQTAAEVEGMRKLKNCKLALDCVNYDRSKFDEIFRMYLAMATKYKIFNMGIWLWVNVVYVMLLAMLSIVVVMASLCHAINYEYCCCCGYYNINE